MNLFRKKSIDDIIKSCEADNQHGLAKHLGVRDLTAFGIAAIIGAGIFTTIGQASADGGPGVIFLFLFTSMACTFAAFAYAEFASVLPVSGSAYTYSYVAFGELFAWIIGWALIMEYGIGNITVAIGWSGYFTGLLGSMGLHLPEWMTIDYLSASSAFEETRAQLASGKLLSELNEGLREGYLAWLHAPDILGLRVIADFPALLIIVLITWLVYRGIKETRNASNAMVVIKLAVVLLVIAVGVFYVDSDNWNPFAPNGVTGILKGVSAVFFAYIGFDAISTTAEECTNPQRDLPKGMMYAIIICTILYVLIALVLTGMVNYSLLAVNDPLAFVFEKLNLKWLSGIIAVSAVVAMASVLLVFQMGQPRIWMSMSRDGLLPKRFSKIHPKFNTPSFSTIVTGLLVGGGALFMNMATVTDLCSIGTLFAFVLVCAGVLRLETLPGAPKTKFRTPYINSKFIAPALLVLACVLTFIFNPFGAREFFTSRDLKLADTTFARVLNEKDFGAVNEYANREWNLRLDPSAKSSQFQNMKPWILKDLIRNSPLPDETKYESGFMVFAHNIPMWIFWIIAFYLTIRCYIKKYSLIPVLGLLSCLYMMAQIDLKNWIGFSIWLVIGLVIYFTYSNKNSKLAGAKTGTV
jgi:basic amino acid/polyamine antiporter, APA family